MGKTQSIQKEAEQNNEFQDYLNSLHEELEKKCDVDFSKRVERFYDTTQYDRNTLATDTRWDFRQESSFEPARISNFVSDAVKSIISGGSSGATDALATGLSMLANYENVVASVASSIVLATMNIFSTSIKVNYFEQYSDSVICPGVTLHILTFADSFQRSDYFNNEIIVETGVRYELSFSKKKAQVEATMANMVGLVETIRGYNEAVSKLDREIAAGALTKPIGELMALNERSRFFRSLLNDASKNIRKAGGPAPKALKLQFARTAEEPPSDLSPERLAIYQAAVQRLI